jgi:hypothetical protein
MALNLMCQMCGVHLKHYYNFKGGFMVWPCECHKTEPIKEEPLTATQRAEIQNECHKLIRYVIDTECREIIEKAEHKKTCDEIIAHCKSMVFLGGGTEMYSARNLIIESIKQIRDRQ